MKGELIMTVYAVMYKNDLDNPYTESVCRTAEIALKRVECLQELGYEAWVKEMPILED